MLEILSNDFWTGVATAISIGGAFFASINRFFRKANRIIIRSKRLLLAPQFKYGDLSFDYNLDGNNFKNIYKDTFLIENCTGIPLTKTEISDNFSFTVPDSNKIVFFGFAEGPELIAPKYNINNGKMVLDIEVLRHTEGIVLYIIHSSEEPLRFFGSTITEKFLKDSYFRNPDKRKYEFIFSIICSFFIAVYIFLLNSTNSIFFNLVFSIVCFLFSSFIIVGVILNVKEFFIKKFTSRPNKVFLKEIGDEKIGLLQ